MKTTVAALALIPLFLSACVATQAPRPDLVPSTPLLFNVPQVDHATLSNGIRVYLKPDRELPLIEMTALVEGGAVVDPAAKVGLADLAARSLRSGGAGTRTPDQVDQFLENLAIDFSVSADPYAITLGMSLLGDDLDQGLSLLSDTLRQPLFAEERVELARKEMVESIRRQNDRPASIAGRTLLKSIFGDHPFGRQATETTVAAIGRDDLLAFHRAHFQPQRLWLAISGDFDPVEMLATLERLFGDWPRGVVGAEPLPPVTAPPRPAVIVASKELSQTVVQIGELGVSKDAPDLAAIRVMNFILGSGGFNSRLMREVRAVRGLAYSVHAYHQIGRRLPGPFVAQCETKNASALKVVSLIKGEMERMRSEPVTEEELRTARDSLINSFVFSFTNPHEIATQALRLDLYGYPADYLQNYRAQVEAVTPSDVQQAARNHLHPDTMTIVLVGNEKEFDAPPESLGLPVERISP